MSTLHRCQVCGAEDVVFHTVEECVTRVGNEMARLRGDNAHKTGKLLTAILKIERLEKLVMKLKRGGCWCGMAAGNPLVRDHSEACREAMQVEKRTEPK